jgi:hypothetical protein
MIGHTTDDDDGRDPAAREKRRLAFRERSKQDLEAEAWEEFTKLGLERVRVLGGWLYRALDGDKRAQPMTFVPDPPRIVQGAAPGSYGPSR